MKLKYAPIALGGVLVLGMILSLGLITRQEPLAPQSVYLALGDSVAFGTGASNPATTGYVPVFHDSGPDPLRLINLAVPGETSSSFVAAGGQLEQALAVINDPNIDVQMVTLNIGANDLLRLLRRGSPCSTNPISFQCQRDMTDVPATFGENYVIILSALTLALERDPGDEDLLVMAYYNPFDGTGNIYESIIHRVLVGSDGIIECDASGLALGLNDMITCIGRSYGATVVNVHPMFEGRALELTHIGRGDIHPNDSGHMAIAHAFQEALR